MLPARVGGDLAHSAQSERSSRLIGAWYPSGRPRHGAWTACCVASATRDAGDCPELAVGEASALASQFAGDLPTPEQRALLARSRVQSALNDLFDCVRASFEHVAAVQL